MNLPSIDARLWLALAILGGAWGLAVVVVEIIAIINQHGDDTLTEVIRSLNIPSVAFFAGAGLLIGIVVWAAGHLIGFPKW